MALIGDTIRLNVEFKNFQDTYVDATELTFTVYDERRNIITPTTLINSSYKYDTGKYQYDYIIPDGKGNIIYEFKGIIEGNPQIGRGIIKREFVR